MELKKIRKTSKELELEVTGENETMLNPITETLLKNKDVDYASYITDHPESNKRRLYLRVKKGEPLDMLKKAVKQVESELKDFEKNFSGKKTSKSKTKTKSKKKAKKTKSESTSKSKSTIKKTKSKSKK
ncbi:MAG: DNA-directed RNA polymerase subunit L [Candidatus Thermoplasmatota archaeon]|nr:DNA-directed RNA polymerase subunit L [Candidatus Thermoplasmatota archaeon]